MAAKPMKRINTKPRMAWGGLFQYGYIASPKQMAGSMEPFSPCWWAQIMTDGTQEFFDTKRECLAWMRKMRNP